MKRHSILLGVILAVCLRAAAAVPPAEKLLPDDTLMLVTTPDWQKTMAVYSSNPQTQLWNDPAMQAFRIKLTDKFKSTLITPLEHDLGVHFDDYTSLPQGQLTLAIVQDGWQGKPGDDKLPGFVLLLDTKDKSGQLKSNLADLKKKWADAGKTIKTEKIRDVEFSAITVSANDIPKTLRPAPDAASPPDGQAAAPDAAATPSPASAPKAMIYIGQADSLLIMANSPKVIEKILAALNGGGGNTLGDVPEYAANHSAMFRDAPLYGWVNLHSLVAIMKTSLAAESAGDTSGLSSDKIIAAAGLEGVRTAAFAYQFSNDGAQFNFLLGVPEDARSGIFKMIAGEPKDCNPPPFVPADAVKFFRYRLDGQKFYDGVRKIINDVSAQSLGGLDFMLGSAESQAREKNPDFDLKKDLFGNLGDDIISYQKGPKSDTLADLNSPPSITLVGSPNPEHLGNALNVLLALAGPQGAPKEREFLGHKIYSVPMPFLTLAAGATGATASSPSTPTLNYASSGGYLALSMDATMIEEYLRSSQGDVKSLNDLRGLSAAKAKVSGPGTSLFGYSDDAEITRAFVKMLKSDSGGGQLGSMFQMYSMFSGLGSGFNFKDWVDVSLLPDYDKISKYFGFSVYAGGATPDGLVFKAYAPTPPQLIK